MMMIVSMIRYVSSIHCFDTYRRYIYPIHDMYHDTYRIIYSIKNIAETVIKKKFPLTFRAGQFVADTF